MLFNMSNTLTDEDIYLKIRYSYAVSLKKIDSFSKELLKFKYNKKMLSYIKDYIRDINDDIYSKEHKKKTIEFENKLLGNNKFINLEIIFYALNKLIRKRITKKQVTKEIIEIKKEKLMNVFKEKKGIITKLEYKRIIDKLDTISLVLFIEYAVNNIQNKSDK